MYRDFRLEALARLAAFDFPVELNDATRGYFEKSASIEADPKIVVKMLSSK